MTSNKYVSLTAQKPDFWLWWLSTILAIVLINMRGILACYFERINHKCVLLIEKTMSLYSFTSKFGVAVMVKWWKLLLGGSLYNTFLHYLTYQKYFEASIHDTIYNLFDKFNDSIKSLSCEVQSLRLSFIHSISIPYLKQFFENRHTVSSKLQQGIYIFWNEITQSNCLITHFHNSWVGVILKYLVMINMKMSF